MQSHSSKQAFFSEVELHFLVQLVISLHPESVMFDPKRYNWKFPTSVVLPQNAFAIMLINIIL